MPLEEYLVKDLCQAIEDSGKTRNEFNTADFQQKEFRIYGGPTNSNRRRNLQKKFDEIKRKSPQSYQRFLDKFRVIPGEGLKRELRDVAETTRKSSFLRTITTESDSESDDDEDDDDDKPTPNKTSSSPKYPILPVPAKVLPKHPTPPVTPKMKPTNVPPATVDGLVAQISSMVLNQAPAAATMSSWSTTSSEATATETSAFVLQQVETLTSFKMDGSDDYPYIIIVDPNKPEANWGFEVSLVPQVEFKHFTRDIYHIRKVVGQTQIALWEARIPTEKYPHLARRAVLIKGPSQDYWHQDAMRYHAEMKCDRTRIVHQTLQTSIAGNPARMRSTWLLVFPPTTQFENHVLSGDANYVLKETLDLYGSIWEGNEEIQLLGTDVHWRIALKGGEMICSPDASNAKKRFANRKKKK
jgi:hypothetical protein